ncbi:hypothetical protein [Rhizobacter sp. P5_C2]|jgi:hypothetical protein
MAIDLNCYTSYSLAVGSEVLGRIARKSEIEFNGAFSFSKIRPADEVHKEIAAEFGISAETVFLVGLTDKMQAARVGEVAELIRTGFGEGRVIVLIGNERPI